MKIKKYNDVIITDEYNRPMAWDENGNQLAYCTNSDWQDEHHPVTTYTVKQAEKLIKKSFISRAKGRLTPTVYKTMPLSPPLTNNPTQDTGGLKSKNYDIFYHYNTCLTYRL